MDSFADIDDDPTLPIDLDQTGNFARFLSQHQILASKNISMQTDVEVLQISQDENPDSNKEEGDSEAAMERPLSRGGLMREQENIISELKKECFGLKMRIYYMEERLHDIYDGDTENVVKANIELNVKIEHLKNDLQEKSDLLQKASQAMEQMVSEKEKKEKETEKSKIEETINKVRTEERSHYEKVLENKNKDMVKLVEEIDVATKKIMEKDKELLIKDSIIKDLRNQISNFPKDKLSDLEKENLRMSFEIQELQKKIGDNYKLQEDYEKELISQNELIIQLRSDLETQKSDSHKQMCNNEKNVKALRACLHEKEMEFQKSKTNFEEKVKELQLKNVELLLSKNSVDLKDGSVQVENNETLPHRGEQELKERMKEEMDELKLKLEHEQERYFSESNEKLDAKQARIVELEQLCKELKLKCLKDLRYKDSVIVELVHATHTKDAFIKNLVKSTADEETKKSQEYTIEQLQQELLAMERSHKETMEKMLNDLKIKENDVIMAKKNVAEKESVVRSLETKYALVREEFRNMDINKKEQEKVIKHLKESLDEANRQEKDLSNVCMEEMKEKDKLIDRLTNLLTTKDNEFKKLEDYFDSLLQNINKKGSIDEVKSISENIYAMVKSHVEQKNELAKELCLLRKSVISSEGKKFDQLLNIIQAREAEMQKLQKAFLLQQEEKNEMLKDLSKQLVGTEQELKQLNLALLNLQLSQEKESQFLLASIKEKDEAITFLTNDGKDKDSLIEKLRIQLDKVNLENKEAKSDHNNEASNNLEDVVKGLEELKKLSEKEKDQYFVFFDKIQNNLHPESLKNVIENEINEFSLLRDKMQELFIASVSDNISLEKLQGDILSEHFQLKELYKQKNTAHVRLGKEIKKLQNELDDKCTELQKTENQLHLTQEDFKENNKELETLKMKSLSLQKKFDDLQVAFDNIVEANNETKSQNANTVNNLKCQLKEMQDENERLINENKKLSMEVTALQERITSSSTEMTNLTEKLADVVKSNDIDKKSLKKDVKELCNINERLRNKIKEINKKLETLKIEKEADRKYHDEKMQLISEKLKETNNEKQKLSDKNAILELKCSNVKDNEIAAILSKCESLEKSILELQTKEASHMNEQVSLKTENASLIKENDSLQAEIKSLKDLIETKYKTENDMFACKEEVLEKKLEINILQNDLAHYKEKCQDCQSLITNLTSQNDYLKRENDVFVNKQKVLKNQLHTAMIDQNEFARLQQELENLRARKEMLESQVRELGLSAGGMKHKLSESHDQSLEKDKEIDQLKSHILKLEEQIESFSPIHTSSRHNIALSSDAFTQTKSSVEQPLDDNSLIQAHIKEMRELRKQLAETIANNDILRKQLEERLSQIESDARHLQDPLMRAGLVRDNDVMRMKIKEQETTIVTLKEQVEKHLIQKQTDEETIEKLLKQIQDLNELSMNLKLEMEAYDRLVQKLGLQKTDKTIPETIQPTVSKEDNKALDQNLLLALLNEIRHLREQLQQSIEVNNSLREKLEEELGRPVSISPYQTPYCKPVTDSTKRTLFSSDVPTRNTNGVNFYMSPDETPTKDNDDSWSSKLSLPKYADNSPHLLLSVKSIDFDLLKQLVHMCVRIISTAKKELNNMKNKEKLNFDMEEDLNEIYRILKEIWNILLQFHVETMDDDFTKSEVELLKGKISEMQKSLTAKDDYIKSTLSLLMNKYTNHENIEQAIADKLMKAKETIKTTKCNLKNKSVRTKRLDSSGDSEKFQL